MSRKMRPDDWDRLFAPNAPRRGGPLQVLANVVIAILLIVLLGGGATYILSTRSKQIAAANATATVVAATTYPLWTATAIAQEQYETSLTATALAARSTPTAGAVAGIGSGTVTRGGNLRSEPRVANDTIVGLLWAGDQLTFLEQREVDGQTWYRVQLTRPAANRSGAGVTEGTVGWASSLIVTPPTPAP